MAISSWPGVPCQSAYAPLDVIGYNDYFGWFGRRRRATTAMRWVRTWTASTPAIRPRRCSSSEFGFEANRNGPVEVRGAQFQAGARPGEYHLGVLASKPYLAGAIWIALQTIAARPGWTGADPDGDTPSVHKGEVDQFGNPTPCSRSSSRSIARRSRSDRSPRRRLGTGPVRARRGLRCRGSEAPAPSAARRNRYSTGVKRQRTSVAITRKPSTAVSFLPSSLDRAR